MSDFLNVIQSATEILTRIASGIGNVFGFLAFIPAYMRWTFIGIVGLFVARGIVEVIRG